jgi:hypothetical protein
MPEKNSKTFAKRSKIKGHLFSNFKKNRIVDLLYSFPRKFYLMFNRLNQKPGVNF